MKTNYLKLTFSKAIIIIFIIFIANTFALNASDRTDALSLKSKCDSESKILEIPLRNFGEENDIKNFEEGIKTIKLGKIKVAQSKYREAINLFKKYLSIQYNIYKSLAAKYIKRTERINDESAMELVDFVDNPKTLKNFEGAFSYITNAKKYNTTKHYSKVIGQCRSAKKYLFDNYKISGKEIPDDYKKDFVDISNRIFKK